MARPHREVWGPSVFVGLADMLLKLSLKVGILLLTHPSKLDFQPCQDL